MLFIDKQELFFENRKVEKIEKVSVTWLDHQTVCETCRAVDVASTATLGMACAIGAPLLAEYCMSVNKPAQRARETAVRGWAEKAGTFKTRRGNREAVRRATRHK